MAEKKQSAAKTKEAAPKKAEVKAPKKAGVSSSKDKVKKAEKSKETIASVIPTAAKAEKIKPASLTTEIFGIDGKAVEKMTLPESYFGAKINQQLLIQAIRVYLANQREGSAATKTRGMVTGSTRKIFRQKGTGNARHGAITAPIFVGGGVALGPQPKSYRLELSKKMRKHAVASALTYQYQEGSVKVVDELTKLPLKTKSFAKALTDLSCTGKTLVVISKEEHTVKKALRNIKTVDILPVSDIHTYAIMNHAHILFSKQAVTELPKQ